MPYLVHGGAGWGVLRSEGTTMVKAALVHPNGVKMSDSQIAEHVGVSHPFVGKIRKQLAADGSLETVTSRTGRDGRTTNTANNERGHDGNEDPSQATPRC